MRIVSELAGLLRSLQLLSEEDEQRLRELGVSEAPRRASSEAVGFTEAAEEEEHS
jgi:hypothetical protein